MYILLNCHDRVYPPLFFYPACIWGTSLLFVSTTLLAIIRGLVLPVFIGKNKAYAITMKCHRDV